MKKFGKKLLTFVMTFTMVAGVWGGMKLDARAADKYADTLQDHDIVKEGDYIVFPAPSQGKKNKIYCYFNGPGLEDSLTGVENIRGIEVENEYKVEVKNGYCVKNGKTYNHYGVNNILINRNVDGVETWYHVVFYATDQYTEEIASSENSKSNNSEQSTPNSHICDFQWITKVDPTTGADGLEEYKCTGCGIVKESHSIPASVAVIKDFYGNVKEAPENGSITYDSGKLYTISDYLLKKMSERNDVTVTIQFEYQGAKYELTFPAGTDYSAVLTDEETMYGYFGVAAKLGLKVVAK